jgi:hypothetical protein
LNSRRFSNNLFMLRSRSSPPCQPVLSNRLRRLSVLHRRPQGPEPVLSSRRPLDLGPCQGSPIHPPQLAREPAARAFLGPGCVKRARD